METGEGQGAALHLFEVESPVATEVDRDARWAEEDDLPPLGIFAARQFAREKAASDLKFPFRLALRIDEKLLAEVDELLGVCEDEAGAGGTEGRDVPEQLRGDATEREAPGHVANEVVEQVELVRVRVGRRVELDRLPGAEIRNLASTEDLFEDDRAGSGLDRLRFAVGRAVDAVANARRLGSIGAGSGLDPVAVAIGELNAGLDVGGDLGRVEKVIDRVAERGEAARFAAALVIAHEENRRGRQIGVGALVAKEAVGHRTIHAIV